MGREYTIGEAAERLNVSRDTLRFYEKKKLVKPRKGDNGYRYYSDDDIQMLLDFVFLRKLQCSIQDIQLFNEDGSLDSMCSSLDFRVKEEEHLIRLHQQLLKQLMAIRHTREKIQQHLHHYTLRSIPRTYIFSRAVPDYDAVRGEWFRVIREDKNLENCYLHEQWNIRSDHTVKHQCYLVLEEYAVNLLNLEEQAKNVPSFQFDQCVYTVYASETISPQWKDIQPLMDWAKNQNLVLTGEIHAHYLWNHYQEGKLKTSYLELYLPVKQEN